MLVYQKVLLVAFLGPLGFLGRFTKIHQAQRNEGRDGLQKRLEEADSGFQGGEHTQKSEHLRTVIAKFVVECILRAKIQFLKPDRSRSLKGPEKKGGSYHRHSQCKIRVTWKLTLPFQQSHIAPNLTDCENPGPCLN